MKVEKKAVRSGILKLEKNVQITLGEDMKDRKSTRLNSSHT
mgnify:CR=1 FL=1